jgi:CBS domain-containing protein
MRIGEVMRSPVVTVPPDAQLKDVAAILVEHGINAVPVIDASDRLVGIVSEADLLSLEAPPGPVLGRDSVTRRPSLHTAREVMSRSVYTLTEDTGAAAAVRMLLRHNLKSVPVVAGDRVVGIVARRDLLRLIARGDDDVRADLERRLKEEIDALQRITVEVADGVVTIDAAVGTLGRQLLEGLAHTVPGVVEVRMSQAATDGFEPAEADRP